MAEVITPTAKLKRRWQALTNERSSWVTHWSEISQVTLPRSGRFMLSDRNLGARRHNSIYDSTATRALRTLAAGMMAGMTSPARPWFRLATSDADLMDYEPVKLWLSQVTRIMLSIFAKSNTYTMLHSCYEELGAFGTFASVMADDFDNVIHNHTMTAGEYCIATDHRNKVNTCFRQFEMQVGSLVGQFGLENCSDHTRSQYGNGNYDAWVEVLHAIEPRMDRDPSAKDARNMPWRSVYIEPKGPTDKFLAEGGFKDFNVLAPRWAVNGGDIYGNSPGMEALGDNRQLQHQQLRKAQVIDFQTKPPLQGPAAFKGQESQAFLPGGVVYHDGNPQAGVRPLFEVNLDLGHLLVDIQDVRRRIKEAFYADLFLMLASMDTGHAMTATEVAERHEEKLLMLGPVLERLHNELLSPLIELTFAKMLRAGIVPPPPEELNGQELDVEFVSMLAQAQRAVGTNSVDRFVGNLGVVANFKPDVLDKFDSDKWAEKYADQLGIDPELIVPSEQVALVRKQRAQQQQAAAAAEQAKTMSEAGKNLGSINTAAPNAASNILNQFSGYSSPAPENVQ